MISLAEFNPRILVFTFLSSACTITADEVTGTAELYNTGIPYCDGITLRKEKTYKLLFVYPTYVWSVN